MAALLTLSSEYRAGRPGHGSVSLRLFNGGDEPLHGFRLAVTSIVQLHPRPEGELRLARRVSGYHELALPTGFVLEPGTEVELSGLLAGHTPRHANDGPVSAFVIRPDATTIDVEVEPMTRIGDQGTAGFGDGVTPEDPQLLSGPALVPWPVHAEFDGRTVVAGAARLESVTGDVVGWWGAVAAAERRLFGDDAPALATDDASTARWTVAVELFGAPPSGYRIAIDGERVLVGAGDPDGFRHAFVTLAQLLRGGPPEWLRIDDAPTFGWRGLHVDVARQFMPAGDVGRLVDLAAWRKLDRLHLHLTDDEAWRFPVDGYPALTDVGGWRGHGLPIPPLLGSPAAATGGTYTTADLRSWAERAAGLGVVIVPEVDVPGHCHAALTAMPALRDPDDHSDARSVQHFVDNVLYPGLPTTMPFVEAVFGTLASVFDAPWLHVGGDELPERAWHRSPVAAAYARRRAVSGTDAIAAALVADVVGAVRRSTGRRVGAWQEAAEIGGVVPGDGYVVAWKSAVDALRLAEAGHDVVISAPDAYYLDMAVDGRWESPGASWADHVGLDDTCAFRPGAGWSAGARRHLLGIQACVWTEHIRTPAAFDAMVFPRLDAVAERAWLGRIDGGPASLASRAAAMPRLG